MSGPEPETKEYTCPLCGKRFNKDKEGCMSCPLASQGSCNVVCCPNCGYSFSDESRIVEWFRKKFGSRKSVKKEDSNKPEES